MQTDWEGGHYPLTLEFTEAYPIIPPDCKFPGGFLHPNVYEYFGRVCMSFLGYVSDKVICSKFLILKNRIIIIIIIIF